MAQEEGPAETVPLSALPRERRQFVGKRASGVIEMVHSRGYPLSQSETSGMAGGLICESPKEVGASR